MCSQLYDGWIALALMFGFATVSEASFSRPQFQKGRTLITLQAFLQDREVPGFHADEAALLSAWALELGERDEEDAMQAVIVQVRDQMLGTDAVKRRAIVSSYLMAHEQKGEALTSRQALTAAYAKWLLAIIQPRRGLAALRVALEDGWLEDEAWRLQLHQVYRQWPKASWSAVEALRVAEVLGCLGDSRSWRAWRMLGATEDMTLMKALLHREDMVERARLASLLLARQSTALGVQLARAMTTTLILKKPVTLESVLESAGQEIQGMTEPQLLDVSALVRSYLYWFPLREEFPQGVRNAMAPVLEAETRNARRELQALLSCAAWEGVPERQRQLDWLSQRLRWLAAADAAKARAVFRHIVQLLKPLALASPKADGHLAEGIMARALAEFGAIPQLINEALVAARLEGLSQTKEWPEMLAKRLTDFRATPRFEDVLGLFDQTPWVQDIELLELPLTNDNRSTLLNDLIAAVTSQVTFQNRYPISSPAKVAKLQQRLENARPQTFGSKLALARLAFAKERSSPGMNTILLGQAAIHLIQFIKTEKFRFGQLSPTQATAVWLVLSGDKLIIEHPEIEADMQVLKRGGHQHRLHQVQAWLQAESFDALNMSPEVMIQQVEPLLLERSGLDRVSREQIFLKVCQLCAKEDELKKTPTTPKDFWLSAWIDRTMSLPGYLALTVKQMDQLGRGKEPWFLVSLRGNWSIRGEQKPTSEHVLALELVGLLDDLPQFRACAEGGSSLLFSALWHWRLPNTPAEDCHLLSQMIEAEGRKTFGAELFCTLLMLPDSPTAIARLKPYAEAVQLLPEDDRQAVVQMLRLQAGGMDALTAALPEWEPLFRAYIKEPAKTDR